MQLAKYIKQLAKSERNWRTLICKAIGRCRCPRTKTIIPRLTPLPVSSLSPSPPPPVNTGLIRGMPDYAYSPVSSLSGHHRHAVRRLPILPLRVANPSRL
jgi:hypothetical protein